MRGQPGRTAGGADRRGGDNDDRPPAATHEPQASHWRSSSASREPSFRNASVIAGLVILMACLFVTTYVHALGSPVARHVTIGLVGDAPERATFLAALEEATSQGLSLRPAPSLAAAERAVEQQKAFAVLAFAPGSPVRLEVSSASGNSVARLLSAAYPHAAARAGVSVSVVDLHPLPPADPSGLTIFYLVVGATLMAILGVFQLKASAKPLNLRPWLAFDAAMVVLGSLGLLLVVDVLLDAVSLPFLQSWGVLALLITAASTFAGTMVVLVGRWAIIPAWLLFVVFGNSSSGGAVSPPLLPEPFSLFSKVLPSGAAIESLRTAAYFPTAQHAQPLLVLSAWALGSVVALVVSSRLRHLTPAT